jgi:type IV pilus assembly protein PilE
MNRKKGFTLIELLVVVLIIGILAAIALPQYQVAVLKSRFATVMSNTKAIKNAAEMYYLIHGEYSVDNLTVLDIDMPGCSKGSDIIICIANNTSYNYNGNAATGQRYDIMGMYDNIKDAYGFLGHYGRLRYTMVLDNDPSNDRGKIFCQIYDTKDYTAAKVCESMGGKKINSSTWQL